MTLFANSGVAWPQHEPATKVAGRKTLEAASGVFMVLAAIEGGLPPTEISKLDLMRCAESLDEAAKIYEKIAQDLRGEIVDSLTPSELKIAAIQNHRYLRHISYEFYATPYYYEGPLEIGALYGALEHRLSRLSGAIRTLKTSESIFDLAPQAFQIFSLLESTTTLARLIATLGRRRPVDGE